MKNYKLELVRGIAAILVFIGHLVSIHPQLYEFSAFKFLSCWGTEAVIIFFLLSGIVIHISIQKRKVSRITFAKDRLLRIYPQYLIGLILAVITGFMGITKIVEIKVFFGNLLFLGTFQNYICSVLDGNPVIWSLTFEIFFYTIFFFTIGKNQKNMIHFWLFLSLISTILYYFEWNNYVSHIISMFAFSTIWLIGYMLVEYKSWFGRPNLFSALFYLCLLPGISRLQITDNYYCVLKYILFSIVAIPFFLYLIKNEDKSTKKISKLANIILSLVTYALFCLALNYFSQSLYANKLFYLTLPTVMIIILLIQNLVKINIALTTKTIIKTVIKKVAFHTGKLSYSIYIIHYPILLLMNFYFSNSFQFLILSSIVTIMISIFLEYYVQTIFKIKQYSNR